MSKRYQLSEEFLERALKVIPLGTQTFSKSKTQYPYGVSPYYIEKALGSRVWDVDGNEYIDYVNSLAAITLGYNDTDVTTAVKKQLDNGTIYSLANSLEIDVAEKIVEMVPCAEKVRFGKNGSDATAGAIRVARAFTKRDHIAVCGYHGWQDWYIGSTYRNKGVPKAVCDLTHTFKYNDLDSLKQIFDSWPNEIAAVIMEPMNVTKPDGNFLSDVRELAHRNGALLIFDETVTGFRYANGGAQEFFSVIPDLATFGKGLANGYPLSAVAGQEEIMSEMEEIFFSFTFGGETLSLAAAKATLEKLTREPVVKKLSSQGTKIMDGVDNLIKKHDIIDILDIKGHPSWSFIIINDTPQYNMWQIKTLFMQEMLSRGMLILGSHNMSYAHSDRDIEDLLTAYDQVFPIIRDAVKNLNMEKYLQCKPLEALFKIR